MDAEGARSQAIEKYLFRDSSMSVLYFRSIARAAIVTTHFHRPQLDRLLLTQCIL